MAFTDVVNTTGELAQEYPELTVLLGPSDGSNPTQGVAADPEADPPVEEVPADTFEGVQCVRVVQSAGGSRLDYAELSYGLTSHLINRNQPASFARVVEVRMPTDAAELLHRGDYVQEAARVEQGGEALTATSQLRGYHFGHALDFYPVSFQGTQMSYVHDDIVFNPAIDDQTFFNMSTKDYLFSNEDVFEDFFTTPARCWTHPEICKTEVGKAHQGQDREEWTLREAVIAVCWLLNPKERFIVNPTQSVLESIQRLSLASPIRDLRIPLGTSLPQALDMLLIPNGFNWYVDYDMMGTVLPDNSVEGESDFKPRLVFFEIGEGAQKELKLQAPGQILDLEESNVNQFSTSNGIGDSFNQVRVYGEFQEREFTFPLFAAWAAEHDDISPGDLAKDGAEYPGKETVWRLFVANEAGEIDNAIPRFGQTPAVPDLRGEFEEYHQHPRRLNEPLSFLEGTATYGDTSQEKQRRPVFIEWSDDAGYTWQPVKSEWTIQLCPDQIGILFDGNEIPTELYDAGDNGRLRITGTIFGDSRITHLAEKQAWAANGRTVSLVVCRPDKFQERQRQTTGTYKSVLTGPCDERDDWEAIEEFAEQLRDRNHYAEIECEFRLPGWHLEYKIGDLITKIAGREINLNAAPAEAPANRYVQIVERRFEMTPQGGPSTVLIVDRGIAPT